MRTASPRFACPGRSRVTSCTARCRKSKRPGAPWRLTSRRSAPRLGGCWSFSPAPRRFIPKPWKRSCRKCSTCNCWTAIGFQKGCYTGQEVVARTHYLGKLKRRMVSRPSGQPDPAPPRRSAVLAPDGCQPKRRPAGGRLPSSRRRLRSCWRSR
ncbi:MAG: tRNA-modifying protein YgfZ [Candidatus Competibacter sp.]